MPTTTSWPRSHISFSTPRVGARFFETSGRVRGVRGDRHRSTTAGAPASIVPTRQNPSATSSSATAGSTAASSPPDVCGSNTSASAVADAVDCEVPGDVVPVAGVAAGAHAPLGGLDGARVGDEPGAVDDQPHAAALGDLPAVPGEAVAGDVGDGVHGVAERLQALRRRPG